MTFSYYLDNLKLALNKIKRVQSEAEAYKCIAEILINSFGFNRATVSKVNLEHGALPFCATLGL
jgi:hypothetical protein